MSVATGQDVVSRKAARRERAVARSQIDVTERSPAAYTAVTAVEDVDKLRPLSSCRSTSGPRQLHVPGGGAGKRALRIVAAALRAAVGDELQAAAVTAADSAAETVRSSINKR